MSVPGALSAGLTGTPLGSFFSKDPPAGGAIPVGVVFGVLGGLYTPRLTDRLGWNDAQVMTAGAGSTWLGIMGGLDADAVKTDGTTARQVLVGASSGSTVGLPAGAALATRDNYTTGDLALVDTFAGIGVAGGFTVGMLMQPAESEAYSVNVMNEYTAIGPAGAQVSRIHDDNGNRTEDGTRGLVWDAFNRLVAVARKSDGAPIARYFYLPDGRRSRKVS